MFNISTIYHYQRIALDHVVRYDRYDKVLHTTIVVSTSNHFMHEEKRRECLNDDMFYFIVIQRDDFCYLRGESRCSILPFYFSEGNGNRHPDDQ